MTHTDSTPFRAALAAQLKLKVFPPAALITLNSITELDLSFNRLQRLPGSFVATPLLSTLNCSHNELSDLPFSIGLADGLTRLDCAFNSELVEFPDSFTQLERLRILNANNCTIKELSPELGRLRSLECLRVDHNAIVTVPTNLSQLESLRICNFSYNGVRSLPKRITLLTGLEQLFLNVRVPHEPERMRAPARYSHVGLCFACLCRTRNCRCCRTTSATWSHCSS